MLFVYLAVLDYHTLALIDAPPTPRLLPPRNGQKILTDDPSFTDGAPTRHNILESMRWLVYGAQPGDSLFFHYSGHGGSVRDKSGDEVDSACRPFFFMSVNGLDDDGRWFGFEMMKALSLTDGHTDQINPPPTQLIEPTNQQTKTRRSCPWTTSAAADRSWTTRSTTSWSSPSCAASG
jgi:hypothetical protein